jgi:hypothetical protein
VSTVLDQTEKLGAAERETERACILGLQHCKRVCMERLVDE